MSLSLSLLGDVSFSKPCSRNSRKPSQKVRRAPLASYPTRNELVRSELAVYHSEQAGSSDAGYATYIIGGEPHVSYLDSVRDTDKMAMDDEEMDEDSEPVPETKITLVREADLESAQISFRSHEYPYLCSSHSTASKEQYARIHFVHIYSLSPSPIHVSIIVVPTFPTSHKFYSGTSSLMRAREMFSGLGK